MPPLRGSCRKRTDRSVYFAMTIHYLDNSATTAVSPAAADKASYMMLTCYGNPSSLHGMGLSAEREAELARERIAESLGVTAKEILFTSGGTEANNTALFGAADALKRRGSRIILSAVEHSSVKESGERLKPSAATVSSTSTRWKNCSPIKPSLSASWPSTMRPARSSRPKRSRS